jgi:hypothetical protein
MTSLSVTGCAPSAAVCEILHKALPRKRRRLTTSRPAHGDLVLTDLREFDRTGLVYERVRTATGNGLANAAHQDHRRQRLIMQPPGPCWYLEPSQSTHRPAEVSYVPAQVPA